MHVKPKFYTELDPKNYTDIDNRAWDLFVARSTEHTLLKNKSFFIYYKDSFPYYPYYDKAKQQLRINKLKKIISNVNTT